MWGHGRIAQEACGVTAGSRLVSGSGEDSILDWLDADSVVADTGTTVVGVHMLDVVTPPKQVGGRIFRQLLYFNAF